MAKDREKILNYTQRKFFSEGFYKTSIDQLARELSISKNTIYKHFRNKDEIVEAIMSEMLVSVSGKVSEIIKSDNDSIHKFVMLMGVLSANIGRFDSRFMKDVQLYTPHIWQKIDTARRKLMFENLSKLIRQGHREKMIKNYPAELVRTVHIGAMTSIANPEFLMNTSLSKSEAIRLAFEIILEGILTSEGKRQYRKLKNKTDEIFN